MGHAEASEVMTSMLILLYGQYCVCWVGTVCLDEHFTTREGVELDMTSQDM